MSGPARHAGFRAVRGAATGRMSARRPNARIRRVAAGGVIAALGAALAGCGGAAAPAATLPPGVEVSLVQLRGDVAARQAQVEVVNGGAAALTVGDVTVEDPRFAGVARRVVDRRSVLPAGGTVKVRVQLPAMDCAASGTAVSTATLELVVGDAAPAAVQVEAPDALGFLPALHARECLADALADVAEVTIASFDPDDPAGASITLSLVPTGAGTATLEAVHSTTLLMYTPAGAGPFRLDVEIGAVPLEVRIPLVPQRCDPHAVQEDKRGTIFTFDVIVDGVAGQVDVPADPDMKARMLTWVAQQCGFG